MDVVHVDDVWNAAKPGCCSAYPSASTRDPRKTRADSNEFPGILPNTFPFSEIIRCFQPRSHPCHNSRRSRVDIHWQFAPSHEERPQDAPDDALKGLALDDGTVVRALNDAPERPL
jgi:hypothetical protein